MNREISFKLAVKAAPESLYALCKIKVVRHKPLPCKLTTNHCFCNAQHIDCRDTSVCLMNYKADGTPFWNQFFVAALRDDAGKVRTVWNILYYLHLSF